MSIAQYIKSTLISNEFNKYYKELVQKIINLKPDTVFTVKDLWEPDEWAEISRGVKLSIGKHLYKNVDSKNIANVRIKGYGISGIMCYVKV